MEEIRSILLQSNTISASAAESACVKAKQILIKGQGQEEISEILWTAVKSGRSHVSQSVCHLLAELCLDGYLNPLATVSHLLSLSSQVTQLQGLVSAVAKIISNKSDVFKDFALAINPHPLVTLLR